MAAQVADLHIPVQDGQRLLTCADLAALPSELPSGPVDWELDNGRLVIMSPTGNRHGAVHSNVDFELKAQGEKRGFGKVRVETGVILWRNPDRVVGPDVAFIANRSLPIRTSPEGFLETIPELVVEIRSKNDRQGEIEAKVGDYLRAGAQFVWIVDPGARTVTVHGLGAEPQVLTEDAVLTVEELIPGFEVLVSDLFRE